MTKVPNYLPVFSARALAVLALASGRVLAAPGDPDLSFGTDGVVPGHFHSIALYSDGRIAALGLNDMVYRFLSNGALDTTFGGVGFAHSPLSLSVAGRSVVVQPDGKIAA